MTKEELRKELAKILENLQDALDSISDIRNNVDRAFTKIENIELDDSLDLDEEK